jgi:hypothetical protein
MYQQKKKKIMEEKGSQLHCFPARDCRIVESLPRMQILEACTRRMEIHRWIDLHAEGTRNREQLIRATLLTAHGTYLKYAGLILSRTPNHTASVLPIRRRPTGPMESKASGSDS